VTLVYDSPGAVPAGKEGGSRRLSPRLSPFWRAQLTAWTFLAVFDCFSRSFVSQDAVAGIVLTLILDPFAMLLTAGMRSVYRRLVPTGTITTGVAFWILSVSLLGGAVFTALTVAVRSVTGWGIPEWSPDQALTIPFVYVTIIFIAWSLAYFWISAELRARNERQRASEAEAEALRTELQRLRDQLDPHFLFNALNGVAAEMPDEPRRAQEMLDELCDYLRRCLDRSGPAVVSLRDEIETLHAYLRIQQARFGSDLSYTVHIDPRAEASPVPEFLLQPLVENAIKHGRLASARLDLRVEVEMPRAGDLCLRVSNAGRLAGGWEGSGSPGVGLSNLRRRLELHYPGRSRFSLTQTGGEVTAELRLTGAPCFG